MNNDLKVIGIGLLGAATLAGVCYWGATDFDRGSQKTGEYRGYRVEAFFQGDLRKIILSSKEDRTQRLIATDLPGGEEFELRNFMATPRESPLREYTSKDIQDAWNAVYK